MALIINDESEMSDQMKKFIDEFRAFLADVKKTDPNFMRTKGKKWLWPQMIEISKKHGVALDFHDLGSSNIKNNLENSSENCEERKKLESFVHSNILKYVTTKKYGHLTNNGPFDKGEYIKSLYENFSDHQAINDAITFQSTNLIIGEEISFMTPKNFEINK